MCLRACLYVGYYYTTTTIALPSLVFGIESNHKIANLSLYVFFILPCKAIYILPRIAQYPILSMFPYIKCHTHLRVNWRAIHTWYFRRPNGRLFIAEWIACSNHASYSSLSKCGNMEGVWVWIHYIYLTEREANVWPLNDSYTGRSLSDFLTMEKSDKVSYFPFQGLYPRTKHRVNGPWILRRERFCKKARFERIPKLWSWAWVKLEWWVCPPPLREAGLQYNELRA